MRCFCLIFIILFFISIISSIELPNDIKVADEKSDYRVKTSNYHIKCINNYLECDVDKMGFHCDEILFKCLNNSAKRHINYVTKMIKEGGISKQQKVTIEEFYDEL